MQAVIDGSGNQGMPVLHEPELKVLNSHGNIHPTALPPFLPQGVAGELVKWLEGLLKHAVNKVVKRERGGSNGSADLRGQSPEEEEEGGGAGKELQGTVTGGNTDATTSRWGLWSLWTPEESEANGAEWAVNE